MRPKWDLWLPVHCRLAIPVGKARKLRCVSRVRHIHFGPEVLEDTTT